MPANLEEVTREAVSRTPGLKLSAIKKSLPVSHQAFSKEAQICLRALAATGAVVRFRKGKTEAYFPGEPLAILDREIPARLGEQPIDKDALKALVTVNAPGYEIAFDAWFAQALARGVLFEHAPPSVRGKKGKKRFGTKPDLSLLKASLSHLRELLDGLEAKGVDRAYLAKIAAETLQLSAPAPAATTSTVAAPVDGRALFVSALEALSAEHPRQALLSVRELRPRVPLSKAEFDELALDLMREGAISLHYHDHAASLPEAERLQFVQDQRGTFFNGIAKRGA